MGFRDMHEKYWFDAGLVVTVVGPDGSHEIQVDKPFARIGSHKQAEVAIGDASVPRRSHYLHATRDGILWVRLSKSVAADEPRRGWLGPGEQIVIGNYRLSARMTIEPEEGELAEDQAAPFPTMSVMTKGREVGSRELAHRLTVVGRDSPSSIRITSRYVSAAHTILAWNNGQLWAIDAISGNGTFVEGEQIEAAAMELGDAIRLGNVDVVFAALPGAEPTVLVEDDELPAGQEAADTSNKADDDSAATDDVDDIEADASEEPGDKDDLEASAAEADVSDDTLADTADWPDEDLPLETIDSATTDVAANGEDAAELKEAAEVDDDLGLEELLGESDSSNDVDASKELVEASPAVDEIVDEDLSLDELDKDLNESEPTDLAELATEGLDDLVEFDDLAAGGEDQHAVESPLAEEPLTEEPTEEAAEQDALPAAEAEPAEWDFLSEVEEIDTFDEPESGELADEGGEAPVDASNKAQGDDESPALLDELKEWEATDDANLVDALEPADVDPPAEVAEEVESLEDFLAEASEQPPSPAGDELSMGGWPEPGATDEEEFDFLGEEDPPADPSVETTEEVVATESSSEPVEEAPQALGDGEELSFGGWPEPAAAVDDDAPADADEVDFGAAEPLEEVAEFEVLDELDEVVEPLEELTPAQPQAAELEEVVAVGADEAVEELDDDFLSQPVEDLSGSSVSASQAASAAGAGAESVDFLDDLDDAEPLDDLKELDDLDAIEEAANPAALEADRETAEVVAFETPDALEQPDSEESSVQEVKPVEEIVESADESEGGFDWLDEADDATPAEPAAEAAIEEAVSEEFEQAEPNEAEAAQAAAASVDENDIGDWLGGFDSGETTASTKTVAAIDQTVQLDPAGESGAISAEGQQVAEVAADVDEVAARDTPDFVTDNLADSSASNDSDESAEVIDSEDEDDEDMDERFLTVQDKLATISTSARRRQMLIWTLGVLGVAGLLVGGAFLAFHFLG
jgi:pSer/pThr/pTyr-binding forkhead associated (FHA) protein